MNNTLVIYDNDGFIINQIQGSSLREPVGIPFMWVTIPQGKYLVKMDVLGEPHAPIFEDLPKSETEILQEQINNLNLALASMRGGQV